MEPNFYNHEYLIIDEISYRFSEPVRGDIVVFRYPDDPRQFFIKRVVGLPGERLVISGGKVHIYNNQHPKGHVLSEVDYLGKTLTPGDEDIKLGEDEYFLMGDNRHASMDSRVFGPVPERFVVGKVLFRGWPPERMRFFTSDVEYEPQVQSQ